jgi:hypothetical protein
MRTVYRRLKLIGSRRVLIYFYALALDAPDDLRYHEQHCGAPSN